MEKISSGTLYRPFGIKIQVFPWLLMFLLMGSLRSIAQGPLKIALAGLNHDHVSGVLQQYRNGAVSIVGIAESNKELIERYKKRYQLPDSIFYKDLPALLKHL